MITTNGMSVFVTPGPDEPPAAVPIEATVLQITSPMGLSDGMRDHYYEQVTAHKVPLMVPIPPDVPAWYVPPPLVTATPELAMKALFAERRTMTTIDNRSLIVETIDPLVVQNTVVYLIAYCAYGVA
jgi:hypothetical protein